LLQLLAFSRFIKRLKSLVERQNDGLIFHENVIMPLNSVGIQKVHQCPPGRLARWHHQHEFWNIKCPLQFTIAHQLMAVNATVWTLNSTFFGIWCTVYKYVLKLESLSTLINIFNMLAGCSYHFCVPPMVSYLVRGLWIGWSRTLSWSILHLLNSSQGKFLSWKENMEKYSYYGYMYQLKILIPTTTF